SLELPLVMFSSLRHCSRSVPVMARNLLLVVLLDAPTEALPLVSLLALPLVLGVVAPTLDPVDPEALPPALPAALLCAAATPASAKSAAAVAVLTSFNIIGVPPTRVEGLTAARSTQLMCLARDFLGLVDADSNRNPARR